MINIDPKTLGQLESYQEILRAVEKLGEVYKAVDLHGKGRDDGGNNAQVLDWLAEGGRDFVTPKQDEVSQIAQAFVDSAMKDLQKKLKTIGTTGRRGKIITSEQIAKQISGKAFKAAGMAWLKIIKARIDEQDWIGSGKKYLSESYAELKELRYGFTIPIGVASGQVYDNVQAASRNLKLRK